MDDGRRRWSGIGPASTFNHGCPLTTPPAPPKFGHTASNMQRGFESTITFTGKNDERLWDAVCQVALRSFDRPFGEYLGKSCVAVWSYVCVRAC